MTGCKQYLQLFRVQTPAVCRLRLRQESEHMILYTLEPQPCVSISPSSLQSKAPSRILFDQICKQLHLLEVDYFGLEYNDLSNVTVGEGARRVRLGTAAATLLMLCNGK